MITNSLRRSGKLIGCAVLAGLGSLFCASTASANLQVDLRFTDGSKIMPLASGNQTVDVDVWAQVTGGADGLGYVYGSVKSTQVGAGALVGAGGVGITGADLTADFKFLLASAGKSANLTPDNIQDWGGSLTAANDPAFDGNDLSPYFGPTTIQTFGAPVTKANISKPEFANTISGGTEFKVGTLHVHIGEINTAGGVNDKTTLSWVTPQWSTAGGQGYHLTYTGLVGDTSDASYLASTAANNVTFTAVPEPASLSLLGLGALGLLARRRRHA